jgi:DNA-binding PadR family transcriptional regulator
MPRKQPAAELALLGLLHLAPEGSHGYDLSRDFSSDGLPGAILRVEAGMLYHYLKRLEKSGLVSSTIELQDARPARQVYHLTPGGQEVLVQWLQEPVVHTREIRIEFLLKLYFMRRIQPEQVKALIRDQLELSVRMMDELTARFEELQEIEIDIDRKFLQDSLSLRMSQTNASIDWLRSLDPA